MKVREIRNNASDASVESLYQLVFGGLRIFQALYVTVKLGVPDLLATGTKSADELAQATHTHAPSLTRVLRLLVAIDILFETEAKLFGLTTLGQYFCAGTAGNLKAITIFEGDIFYEPLGSMLHSVQSGESAYEHLYGQQFFKHLMTNAKKAQLFQDNMTASAIMIADSVVKAYDFSQFKKVVDVGGGQGTLLATILQANSSLCGVLFDRSYVVVGAQDYLEQAGVLARCDIQHGEFFKSIPPGGDVYLLMRIIHDWGDERAIKILENCRAVIPKGGKILVIDYLIEVGGEPNNPQRLRALFEDLTMLTIGGGKEAKERTEQEFRTLFQASGFTLTRTIFTRSGYFILEAVSV